MLDGKVEVRAYEYESRALVLVTEAGLICVCTCTDYGPLSLASVSDPPDPSSGRKPRLQLFE